MRHSLGLLCEKIVKTPKHVGFFEKVASFKKSTIFPVFSRNEALFATFGQKVRQNAETRWFLPKVSIFCQIDELSCFFAKWGTLCNFWRKGLSKPRNKVLSSKRCKIWPNRLFSFFLHEMRIFFPLLPKKFGKKLKHGGFFQNLEVLAKSTIFRVFSRNEELFATFGWKVRQHPKTQWFLRKVASFGQIDNFSFFSAKFATFCEYWLKRSSKRRNTVVASKSLKFWPNRRFFVFFLEMRHFLRLLCEKFVKTPKHHGFFDKLATFAQMDDSSPFSTKWETFCHFWLKSSSERRNTVVSSKNLQVFAKSTICTLFSRNKALFATFAWKVRQNDETRWFLRKSCKFCEIDDFSRFFAKWGTLFNFWPKSSSKRRNTVVSSKSVHFWPNRRVVVFFREMRHSLQLLGERFVKTPKQRAFFETLQDLAKSTIYRVFSRNEDLFTTFGWKVRQNAETRWFLPKVGSVAKSTIFRVFSRNEELFATFGWKVR